jgi:prevent-host-death family protein
MSARPSLLFVNQHYAPDLASTAQHLTDLAEHLAADGFEVHVLCSRDHYLSGEMDVPAEETRNGVHVHRVRTTAFGREATLGRIADYASFFLQVLGRLLTGRRYDAVVSLTTPPLLPVAMAVARLLRGQSYGIWSMDLHPEAETAVGMIDGEGPLGRLLYALTDWSYRRAAFTVDLGPYMKQRIRRKGVPDERLHTIPVWNKKEEVFPISDDENPLVEEVGIQDKFVVMYSGNAGLGVLKTGRNAGDTVHVSVHEIHVIEHREILVMPETRVPVEELQSRLGDWLRRVEEGEPIVITRKGRDVAQIKAVKEVAREDSLPSLEEWRASVTVSGEDLSETVRQQRTEERY